MAIDTLSRFQKQLILVAMDVVLFAGALWASFAIRLSTTSPEFYGNFWWMLGTLAIVRIPVFIRIGMYHSVLRHPDSPIAFTTLKGMTLSALGMGALFFVLRFDGVPRSILLIEPFISTTVVIASREVLARMLRRMVTRGQVGEPVLIYGAGSAGLQLAQSLRYSEEMRPVAFLDDEPSKWGMRMAELGVYPPSKIRKLVEKYGIQQALMAAPSVTAGQRRKMVRLLEEGGLSILEVPSFLDLVRGKQRIEELAEVKAKDLLGRSAVMPDDNLLREVIPGRSVMVTGAGGSIGSELCRQVAALNPTRIVLFEISEYALYRIEMQLGSLYPDLEVAAVLGSVLDEKRVEETLRHFGVDSVYHAAAYKHVPLVEQNPIEGVRNNVQGTLCAARAAVRAGVSSFLFVSTDKAVRPCNVMGASKRLAELAFLLVAEESKHRAEQDPKVAATRFNIVRFGNVLDSAGSVVPLFRRQIASGGPVTVTHRDVQRYFMTIPEAAQLVVQASGMGDSGEVFLLDMGSPVRVHDLAKKMIELATRGTGREIQIEFTGLRPGEKLVEELLVDPACSEPTSHPKIFKAREHGPDRETMARLLAHLLQALEKGALDAVYGILEDLVEGYGRPETAQDVLGRGHCSYSYAVQAGRKPGLSQVAENGVPPQATPTTPQATPAPSRHAS